MGDKTSVFYRKKSNRNNNNNNNNNKTFQKLTIPKSKTRNSTKRKGTNPRKSPNYSRVFIDLKANTIISI